MSNEKKYYVLCGSNCKYEGMTKEQILTAIEQAINNGEITDVDTGFITNIKEQNAGVGLSFWIGSQAEYNALTEKVNNCFYIITDDSTGADIADNFKEIKENIEIIETTIAPPCAMAARNGVVLLENSAAASIVGKTLNDDISKYSLVSVKLPLGYALCQVKDTGDGSYVITGLGANLMSGTNEATVADPSVGFYTVNITVTDNQIVAPLVGSFDIQWWTSSHSDETVVGGYSTVYEIIGIL